MHHCIADGISLARVMLSLTDSAPERRGRGLERATARGRARGRLRRLTAPAEVGDLGALRSATATLAHEGLETLAASPRAGRLTRAPRASWPSCCA